MDDKLPAAIERTDALELENLQLKLEKAQLVVERFGVQFRAKLAELGVRYQFDPSKDLINYDTLQIERR